MKAILVHPIDFMKMINSELPVISLEKTGKQPIDDLQEIRGTLYYQTVRVAPTSENL